MCGCGLPTFASRKEDEPSNLKYQRTRPCGMERGDGGAPRRKGRRDRL